MQPPASLQEQFPINIFMNKNDVAVGNAASLPATKRIVVMRGEQVIMDRDLAELYGVETKRIKEQVNRNIERFPETFMFQLTPSEFECWRSQFATSNADKKGLRYAPYAFTEQGVAMLSAVLRSETAVRVSIEIMNAFVQMRRYLFANKEFLGVKEITQWALQTEQNSRDIVEMQSSLARIMDNFVDPSSFKHFLILNGQKFEADVANTQIYGMAKESVIVIDNYPSVKTLDLLRCVAPGVKVTILSDQYAGCRLTPQIVADFQAARPDVVFDPRPAQDMFHDRYVVVDFDTANERMFHCGASSKDAGGKITTIMQIEDIDVYRNVLRELL